MTFQNLTQWDLNVHNRVTRATRTMIFRDWLCNDDVWSNLARELLHWRRAVPSRFALRNQNRRSFLKLSVVLHARVLDYSLPVIITARVAMAQTAVEFRARQLWLRLHFLPISRLFLCSLPIWLAICHILTWYAYQVDAVRRISSGRRVLSACSVFRLASPYGQRRMLQSSRQYALRYSVQRLWAWRIRAPWFCRTRCEFILPLYRRCLISCSPLPRSVLTLRRCTAQIWRGEISRRLRDLSHGARSSATGLSALVSRFALQRLHALSMRHFDARRCLKCGLYPYGWLVTTARLNAAECQVYFSLSMTVSWRCFHAKPISSLILSLLSSRFSCRLGYIYVHESMQRFVELLPLGDPTRCIRRF